MGFNWVMAGSQELHILPQRLFLFFFFFLDKSGATIGSVNNREDQKTMTIQVEDWALCVQEASKVTVCGFARGKHVTPLDMKWDRTARGCRVCL